MQSEWGDGQGTLAWISSDYFESLLLPQLLRGENDSKQSDEFQAKGTLQNTLMGICCSEYWGS